MRNINHQRRRCLCFKIGFANLQVVLVHGKTFYTMVDLGIANAFGEINLLKHITKLEWAMIRTYFITLARFISVVITLFTFFKFTKNFFKAAFTNALLTFRRNYYCSCLVIVSYITISF